jgi:hypothetical protein
VDNGIIKQTGEMEFEAVVDPIEREQIQSKRKSQQSQQENPNVTVRRGNQVENASSIMDQNPDVELDFE